MPDKLIIKPASGQAWPVEDFANWPGMQGSAQAGFLLPGHVLVDHWPLPTKSRQPIFRLVACPAHLSGTYQPIYLPAGNHFLLIIDQELLPESTSARSQVLTKLRQALQTTKALGLIVSRIHSWQKLAQPFDIRASLVIIDQPVFDPDVRTGLIELIDDLNHYHHLAVNN